VKISLPKGFFRRGTTIRIQPKPTSEPEEHHSPTLTKKISPALILSVTLIRLSVPYPPKFWGG
jgi:hypothetical protein